MQHQHTLWERLLGFGLLIGLAGCQGGHSPWVQSVKNPEPAPTRVAAGPPAKAPDQELPGLQSAQLCLATAESMDRAGRIPEAIALYDKARHLDPNQKKICRRLAILLDRVGQFALANTEYQEAVRLFPGDASLYNDFGYSCYCQGKLPEAEQLLRKAIELDSTQDRAHVNLGLVLGMQGRYPDALESFRRALPEAQARSNLAFIQTSQGKRQEAIASYRAALQQDATLSLARGALAKLEQAPADPVGLAQSRPETESPVHPVGHWDRPGQ